jgi:hydrogenase expression/formation protein HypC
MCLAVPAKLIAIGNQPPLQKTGHVDIGGIVKEINLAFVPEAEVGDYLLIHAGIAISIVDELEARRVFSYLAEIENSIAADNDAQ